MNHRQAAARPGGFHHAINRGVVHQKDVGIGHEQLETANALFVHDAVQLRFVALVKLRANQVKAVVDGAFALRFGVPGVETLLQSLAVRLNREINDSRRATPGGGARAGREIVAGKGAAKRQFHVRVRVDGAGNDVFARRVDDFVGFNVQIGADERDRGAVDPNVGEGIVGGGDDAAVADEGFHDLIKIFLATEGTEKHREE